MRQVVGSRDDVLGLSRCSFQLDLLLSTCSGLLSTHLTPVTAWTACAETLTALRARAAYVDVNLMVEWVGDMDEHDNTDDESTTV